MVENRYPDPTLVTRLEAALRSGPPLGVAVLFGSAALGTNRAESDVDVAILAGTSGFDESAELALNRALTLAAGAEVDLVRIENASTLLRWQIAVKGVVLFESTPGEFARFRARAASEYIDFAPALAYHGEIFRRRLIEQAAPAVTDAALLLAKLTTLREHVGRMERRRPPTIDEFRVDIDRQDALALSLLVALQEASDIVLHIASDEGWGIASSYAESFELLARHEVFAADLAQRMAGIALRNRVAHGYGSVDFERIWRDVPAGVAAMREFAAAIAAYIGTRPGDPRP